MHPLGVKSPSHGYRKTAVITRGGVLERLAGVYKIAPP
jgi:hypothetical protein